MCVEKHAKNAHTGMISSYCDRDGPRDSDRRKKTFFYLYDSERNFCEWPEDPTQALLWLVHHSANDMTLHFHSWKGSMEGERIVGGGKGVCVCVCVWLSCVLLLSRQNRHFLISSPRWSYQKSFSVSVVSPKRRLVYNEKRNSLYLAKGVLFFICLPWCKGEN